MDTATFLNSHRVFDLDEAVRQLAPSAGRSAVLQRLKYFAAQGKVKKVMRGVYASVPPGVDPKKFRPDPFLVAATLRADAIFSHHSALQLLGASHSEWGLLTAFSARRHAYFQFNSDQLRFLANPRALVRRQLTELGVRSVYRFEQELRVTGLERALVEGFRAPHLVGGTAELIESAAGFPVLELPLLLEVLEAYGQKGLWASVGWFLEQHKTTFYVQDEDLAKFQRRVPKVPLYLNPGQRGGVLVRRWNVIVPENLMRAREPDED